MIKLQNLTVYLKDGRNFQIKNARLTASDSELKFYDELADMAPTHFLPFENVAAVIPEYKADSNQPHCLIFLKESYFKVAAYRFEISNNSQIDFFDNNDKKIQSTYINFSEIVALNLVSPE